MKHIGFYFNDTVFFIGVYRAFHFWKMVQNFYVFIVINEL